MSVVDDHILGVGQFGTVFSATAKKLRGFTKPVRVAVKKPHDNQPLALEQFVQELEVMSLLERHLNIVNLLGFVVKGKFIPV